MVHTKKDRLKSFLIVLPSLILIGIFVYLFILWSVRTSFSAWDGIVPDFTFVGLRNYIEVFTTERFQIDLWNTFFFTVFFLTITVGGGLLLAIFIDSKIKAEALFRNIFIYPMALSFVVTGVVWRWIFQPKHGVNTLINSVINSINSAMNSIGIDYSISAFTWPWYIDPSTLKISFDNWLFSATIDTQFHIALIPVFLAASWQFTGYVMAMYLAGLRGIPDEIREAARVDGASAFQTYWHVILPMLRPITLSALIILGHLSLKLFDLIYTMTGKGPGFATDVPGIYMFETTFRGNHYAEGAVISIVMLLLVAVVIIPYLYSTFKKESKA